MAKRRWKKRWDGLKAKVWKRKKGKGGTHTVKRGRKTVKRWKSPNGKVSGYTVTTKPRRGKNKVIKTTKLKVKRR